MPLNPIITLVNLFGSDSLLILYCRVIFHFKFENCFQWILVLFSSEFCKLFPMNCFHHSNLDILGWNTTFHTNPKMCFLYTMSIFQKHNKEQFNIQQLTYLTLFNLFTYCLPPVLSMYLTVPCYVSQWAIKSKTSCVSQLLLDTADFWFAKIVAYYYKIYKFGELYLIMIFSISSVFKVY